ncbi:hypothetical protein HPB52_003586 [Rhipicephalus sanguineus]|uniref:P2X purinoreceptor 7 intracellular domain-containing protein n=1 Tax=Rhipicephalus sanguineus TaxID=34632 RepID=A0A9D4QJ00_RHISA|nr:hypothetical protein HPB52_003586 [Rhipicephalus sanguineus]
MEVWSSDSGDSNDFGREEDAELADPANNFAFDPLESLSEEDSSSPDSDNAMQEALRIGNVQWCLCGSCRAMETETESVCCREIDKVKSLVPDEAACVTEHPTFRRGCLDIHALEIAYYALMEDRPGVIEALEIHRYYCCD